MAWHIYVHTHTHTHTHLQLVEDLFVVRKQHNLAEWSAVAVTFSPLETELAHQPFPRGVKLAQGPGTLRAATDYTQKKGQWIAATDYTQKKG